MNPLDLLEAPIRAALDFIHGVGFTWGWAIVMLTLVVRMLLLPLFVKQYKSARRMQEVAPQMKELQRKHKGNKPKLQEEMMKFYKQNDVNPFGSCLPLLFQAPVFIALYYTLRNQNFQDQTDLSFMGVIPNISYQLTNIGWGVVPLVIVYALSQLISSELSATPTMSKNQRWMMRFMPVGIVFFVFQFPVPAGLVIYWATTNLWTAGQQLVLKRRIEAEIEAMVATGTDDEAGVGSDDDVDGGAESVGVLAADDAPVVARAVPQRRSTKVTRSPVAEPSATHGADGSDVVEDESAADLPVVPVLPETAPQVAESAKRVPQSRKGVSGGPSRPAGRKKPPKRRK
ncbi:MAG: membrane protein insertase YidC [Thermoleophilia bacterium]|nr:membrane protein insertase YidC [Thermoleophilia bacterium]